MTMESVVVEMAIQKRKRELLQDGHVSENPAFSEDINQIAPEL